MQLKLTYKNKLDSALIFILDKLPCEIKNKLKSFIFENGLYEINELRIKANSNIHLIIGTKTLSTNIWIDSDLINKIVTNLCDGSVYAHIDTIRNGYISVGNGIRAGICGKAVLQNETIISINNISSINIRIPKKISFAAEYLQNLLENHSYNISVLIYSPPGVGKTTILRDLVCRLSQPGSSIRHAVIDTREEITTFIESQITSDVYLSYPKGVGIELATKSMTPQIIICDEITSLDEAYSIMHSVRCGVSLVATTHASTFEDLKNKEILKPLLNCGTFDYALGVKRSATNKYVFNLDKLK